MAVTHARSRTEQTRDESDQPLGAYETIWMEGLEQALESFRRINPDVEIHGVHSLHIDEGEWVVGLRCGAAGVSYARIVLHYGYQLEWID
jgi:hypothetical protein